MTHGNSVMNFAINKSTNTSYPPRSEFSLCPFFHQAYSHNDSHHEFAMVGVVHFNPRRHWVPPLDLAANSNRAQRGFERDLVQLREQHETYHLVSTSRNIAFRRLRNTRLRSDTGSPAFVEVALRAGVERVLSARLEGKRVLHAGVIEDEWEEESASETDDEGGPGYLYIG